MSNASKPLKQLLKDAELTIDGTLLVSLTKLHAALSKKRSKGPYVWLRTRSAQALMQKFRDENLSYANDKSIVVTESRKNTAVPEIIAAAYLVWLSNDILYETLQSAIAAEI